jgi:hypothetical protein
MLSFSLADEGRTVEISCDEEGMAKLIKALERVRADSDHIHLRTRANGGHDLDEKDPWGIEGIGEVVLNWSAIKRPAVICHRRWCF